MAALLKGGFFALILLAGIAAGEEHSGQIAAGELRSMANEAVALYREFLALPNDANYPDQIAALNTWVQAAFEARGFTTQLLSTDGSSSIYAERLSANAKKRVLVYLQADGQPVDRSAWHQADPYGAVLKEQTGDGIWEFLRGPRLIRKGR
jgi:acetylornithine deacetylase/succinyl-diaminopimelate desuccinylase-like protein